MAFFSNYGVDLFTLLGSPFYTGSPPSQQGSTSVEIDETSKEQGIFLESTIPPQGATTRFLWSKFESGYWKINFRDGSEQALNYRSTTSLDSAGIQNTLFGHSVSIGCDKVVIGAPLDTADATQRKGAVYIVDPNYDGTSKSAIDNADISNIKYYPSPAGVGYGYRSYKKITRNDSITDTYYGYSVSCACDRIAVGAIYDGQVATNSGAVFLYDINGNLLKKLLPSDWGDTSANMYFGCSVAISAGRVVVGAYNINSGAGAAYIYDLSGDKIRKITASDAQSGDYFGWSIAAGTGRIVVGAPGDDDNGSNAGSAYIFDLGGNEIRKIKPPSGAAGQEFGRAVAAGFERIVVGAPKESHSGYTTNGAAYVFGPSGTFIKRIVAGNISNPNATNSSFPSNNNGAEFGASVTIGDGKIFIGQPYANKSPNTKVGSLWEVDTDSRATLNVYSFNASQQVFPSTNSTLTVYLSNTSITPVVGQYITIKYQASSLAPAETNDTGAGLMNRRALVTSVTAPNQFTATAINAYNQSGLTFHNGDTENRGGKVLGIWYLSDVNGDPDGSSKRIALGAERFDPFDGLTTNNTYGISCAAGCGILCVGGSGATTAGITESITPGNVVGKVKIGKSIGSSNIYGRSYPYGGLGKSLSPSPLGSASVVRRKKSFLDCLDKK